jgi:hypothetical protein
MVPDVLRFVGIVSGVTVVMLVGCLVACCLVRDEES